MSIPFADGDFPSGADLNKFARAYWRKLTEKDVVNTTTETDLLNGEVTIDAGAMSTNRTLRATLLGDYLNNSGGAVALTLAVKFGGTTFYSDSGSMASNASRRPIYIKFEIANLNSASVQFMAGLIAIGAAGAASGIGDLAGSSVATIGTSGTAAVDTTAACALAVTATHGGASASVSCRLKYAVIEVV